MQSNDLVIVDQPSAVATQERSVDIFAAEPEEQLLIAAKWASALQRVVKEQDLAINFGGKAEHWPVEVWQTFAMFAGVHAREVDIRRYDNGTWEAKVEIVRNRDKTIVADGSAICGIDEPTWAKKPEYARRSMAITRATGKAYRSAFSFISVLAGYSPTPAEEMPGYVPPMNEDGSKKKTAPQKVYVDNEVPAKSGTGLPKTTPFNLEDPQHLEALSDILEKAKPEIPKDKYNAIAERFNGRYKIELHKIVREITGISPTWG
jgi:hypothetical protein